MKPESMSSRTTGKKIVPINPKHPRSLAAPKRFAKRPLGSHRLCQPSPRRNELLVIMRALRIPLFVQADVLLANHCSMYAGRLGSFRV